MLKLKRPQVAARRLAGPVLFALRMLSASVLVAATPDLPPEAPAALDAGAHPTVLTLHGDVAHVQGLDMDADGVYVTSVDKKARRAFLHKFSRDGVLVASTDLGDGPRYHPGGISLDGDSLWVPVAEYHAGGTTRILRLDKHSLATIASFMVKDHIGAVTAKGGQVYGANWAGERLYVWSRTGAQMASTANATRIAYQDLKMIGGDLVAAGTTRDQQAGAIDWLNPQTLALRQRLPIGKMPNGLVWTKEGMAMQGGTLYLLPEDGRDGRVPLYAFDMPSLAPLALDCSHFGEHAGRCLGPAQALAAE